MVFTIVSRYGERVAGRAVSAVSVVTANQVERIAATLGVLRHFWELREFLIGPAAKVMSKE
jgi:hypothetical protein